MNYQKHHTAAFLKRQAKQLKKQLGIPHHDALDRVARSAGFENWGHFCSVKKTCSFTNWLAKHGKRSSPLGDLARDAAIDDTWPDASSLDEYRGYLSQVGACEVATRALDRAWRSYKVSLRRDPDQEAARREKRRLNGLPKPPTRKIVFVKGLQPLHISKRVAQELTLGEQAWVSFSGRKALPVIVTEIDSDGRHAV